MKITGIGISTAENYVRFTIDQDPNVILTTDAFDPEQAKHLTALIIAAHRAISRLLRTQLRDSARVGSTLHLCKFREPRNAYVGLSASRGR